jgi:hypothetical protein
MQVTMDIKGRCLKASADPAIISDILMTYVFFGPVERGTETIHIDVFAVDVIGENVEHVKMNVFQLVDQTGHVHNIAQFGTAVVVAARILHVQGRATCPKIDPGAADLAIQRAIGITSAQIDYRRSLLNEIHDHGLLELNDVQAAIHFGPGCIKNFQGVIVVHLNTHLRKDAKYSLVDLFDIAICQRSITTTMQAFTHND